MSCSLNSWVPNSSPATLPGLHQAAAASAPWCRPQPGSDGDVLDPQFLEVQRGRRAVHADVRDHSSWPYHPGAEVERLRHADRLDRHVRALPGGGQRRDPILEVVGAAVEHVVSAEPAGVLQPGVSEVHRDHAGRAGQPGGLDGGQPDRAGAHHDHYVARLHAAVAHAHLVAGGQDVGQEQHLLGR